MHQFGDRFRVYVTGRCDIDHFLLRVEILPEQKQVEVYQKLSDVNPDDNPVVVLPARPLHAGTACELIISNIFVVRVRHRCGAILRRIKVTGPIYLTILDLSIIGAIRIARIVAVLG
jgi:hypothetical protein